MAALTNGRLTESKEGPIRSAPVGANAVIYRGGLGVVNSAGRAVEATATTGLRTLGRVMPNSGFKGATNAKGREVWDATGLSNGAFSVEFEEGIFKWGNSGGGDTIAATDVLKVCYVVDSQTVALTDNGGARSPAGLIMGVDSDGVWVLSGAAAARLSVVLLAYTAFTQTYSTANATVANPTAAAPAAATFAAPVTLTDSTGYSGTHNDTLAATTLPAALTDNSGGVSGGNTIAAVTNANNAGSADVVPTAAAIATLAAKIADYRTMLDIALQNISDVGQKVIEHNTQLAALAADRAADVTQITALVADDLDNRQSINAVVDVLQAAGLAD